MFVISTSAYASLQQTAISQGEDPAQKTTYHALGLGE